jgi:hypothetical protein
MQEEGFEPSKALSQQISHFPIEKGTWLDLESATFGLRFLASRFLGAFSQKARLTASLLLHKLFRKKFDKNGFVNLFYQTS